MKTEEIDVMADMEAEWARKMERMSERISVLENQSNRLAMLTESPENILVLMACAYIAAEFVIPAIVRGIQRCKNA